jgi:hypothetical protein
MRRGSKVDTSCLLSLLRLLIYDVATADNHEL